MKQIKALLGLFVVIAGFYVAFKLMPPYYNQLQFQDAVDAEARDQSYSHNSEEDIKALIMRHAHDNDIPVTLDQVQVRRDGGEVIINVDYVVHVDLMVMPLDLKFHAGSKNKPM